MAIGTLYSGAAPSVGSREYLEGGAEFVQLGHARFLAERRLPLSVFKCGVHLMLGERTPKAAATRSRRSTRVPRALNATHLRDCHLLPTSGKHAQRSRLDSFARSIFSRQSRHRA